MFLFYIMEKTLYKIYINAYTLLW